LFEEEVTWEDACDKGDNSGLVMYTDGLFWNARRGDFDERTADDWGIDHSGATEKAMCVPVRGPLLVLGCTFAGLGGWGRLHPHLFTPHPPSLLMLLHNLHPLTPSPPHLLTPSHPHTLTPSPPHPLTPSPPHPLLHLTSPLPFRIAQLW
jgi:hypothetical protein